MKGGLYKMAVIISVSLNQIHKDFLDEMKVSPSALLRDCINDKIESFKVSRIAIDQLQSRISSLQETITKMGTFIEKHGLFNEYCNI